MILRRSSLLFILILLTAFTPLTAEAITVHSYKDAIRLGDEAFYRQNYDLAELYYQQAAQQNVYRALPLIRFGEIYYAQGKYTRARKAFQDATRMDLPTYMDSLVTTVLTRFKTHWDVYEIIEESLLTEENPASLSPYQAEAAQIMAGKPAFMSMVTPHIRFILKHDPDNIDLIRYLADGEYQTDTAMHAAMFYELLVRLKHNNLALRKVLADAYLGAGLVDQANLQYRITLKEVIHKIHQVRLKQDKKFWKKKRKQILRKIEGMPYPLGQIQHWYRRGQIQKALVSLRQRMIKNPNNAENLVLLGNIYERMGKRSQAKGLYQKAIAINPNHATAHYFIGEIELANRQYPKALKSFQTYTRNTSKYSAMTNPELKSHWIHAMRSMAFIYAKVDKKPLSAVKALKNVIDVEPTDMESMFDLGVIYANAQKIEIATKYFETVIEFDPDSPKAQEAQKALNML